MSKYTIFIDDDGTTQGIKSPVTEALNLGNRQRVSHVEPINRTLRWLFHQLRSRVSDDSYIAGFTRRWPCKWQANLFYGPTLGPFRSRQQAIDAEIQWINQTLEENKCHLL